MGLIEMRPRAATLANQDRMTMDMFEEKRMLSCDKDPEKYTRPLTVQSGWREIQRGDVMTREPVMVEIVTPWQLQKCGALDKDRVAQCEGCQRA